MAFEQQLTKVLSQDGFLAALDQSGGSTPKALKLYGVPESAYSGEEAMYTKVHEMRTRIVTSPAFNGDRILGAILFENTMDRQIGGKGSAQYLWQEKRVVPFLKVDKGLAAEAEGCQLMKDMPELDKLLERARKNEVFGTKMRSVIKQANAGGIAKVVEQQLAVGKRIIEAGLVPIIEPEVDIDCPDKVEAEGLLEDSLLAALDELDGSELVMLKLTLPEIDGFYERLIAHPNVVRVVALSGGYTRARSNQKLARNPGMIASFSRALTEGLSAQQSDADFNAALDDAIQSIFEASRT
ncbi:MAG: fructose bisphosphate aldolase [Planctomycetaceae bacterium]|nr:fructose bisphosphate aldolase [Planctomycetaceae bacterium]